MLVSGIILWRPRKEIPADWTEWESMAKVWLQSVKEWGGLTLLCSDKPVLMIQKPQHVFSPLQLTWDSCSVWAAWILWQGEWRWGLACHRANAVVRHGLPRSLAFRSRWWPLEEQRPIWNKGKGRWGIVRFGICYCSGIFSCSPICTPLFSKDV